MALKYVPHTKLKMKRHPVFNEAWLHDRIIEEPGILGLGDVRLLSHEKTLPGGGRLDLLLFDEDNNRRYEVEVMLGATDPSHIIRTIEYWEIERRRYPGYDHVAVLIAEDITARFLNVLSLFAGSIPLIAIQLDALQVGEQIVLNFVQVLDHTELRVDDAENGDDGGETDRKYWDDKAGGGLMQLCDDILAMVNEAAKTPQEFKYLQGYIGLRSNGVVKNLVWLSPKPTKKIVHLGFLNSNAAALKDRFEEAGIPIKSHQKKKVRVTLTCEALKDHEDVIRQAIVDTVKEFDA